MLLFAFVQLINGQEKQKFLFTKGDDGISIITMGSVRSAHCSVIEYPDFLVIHEVPVIPKNKAVQDDKSNSLIKFIDSIYSNKPIKYILNSHSHGHSLSTVMPFLNKGATLVTTQESLDVYDKKGFFGNKTSKDYSKSIIKVSSDTILLENTDNPIRVLHLKKSDYKSIPTPTYLFFSLAKQKLLKASCMCSLKEFDKKRGYNGTVYSDRLVDVNKIIADKKLDVKNISQLYSFRYKNGVKKLPIFSISYLRNVLKYGRSRVELSEHFQKMSYEELTTKKDSLLNYLLENHIYAGIVNHAVYNLIEKKEYGKSVALAQILFLYSPKIDYMDTLGEAYFNNENIKMAKHYDELLKKYKNEELGFKIWEKNKKERLEKGK